MIILLDRKLNKYVELIVYKHIQIQVMYNISVLKFSGMHVYTTTHSREWYIFRGTCTYILRTVYVVSNYK